MQLSDFVKTCSIMKSIDDFVNARRCPDVSVPNSFLVSHGVVDSVAINKVKGYGPVDSAYLTSDGKIEDVEIKSIFSEGCCVFEFLWKNCWDKNARMSENITVGREQNNDIVLPDGRISKLHCCFSLKRNRVHFIDISTFGSTINRAKAPAGNRVFVDSKSEIGVGPYTFNLFSAEDMYRVIGVFRQ